MTRRIVVNLDMSLRFYDESDILEALDLEPNLNSAVVELSEVEYQRYQKHQAEDEYWQSRMKEIFDKHRKVLDI